MVTFNLPSDTRFPLMEAMYKFLFQINSLKLKKKKVRMEVLIDGRKLAKIMEIILKRMKFGKC